MVIRVRNYSGRRRGSLMVELLVAMAILLGVLIPLGWSLASERRLARSLYQRSVAMGLVDGEMEVLVAGEWKALRQGTNSYKVETASVTNLPPGRLLAVLEGQKLRLEWRPEVRHHGGSVVREATVR
jgi:hypothetical protein